MKRIKQRTLTPITIKFHHNIKIRIGTIVSTDTATVDIYTHDFNVLINIENPAGNIFLDEANLCFHSVRNKIIGNRSWRFSFRNCQGFFSSCLRLCDLRVLCSLRSIFRSYCLLNRPFGRLLVNLCRIFVYLGLGGGGRILGNGVSLRHITPSAICGVGI